MENVCAQEHKVPSDSLVEMQLWCVRGAWHGGLASAVLDGPTEGWTASVAVLVRKHQGIPYAMAQSCGAKAGQHCAVVGPRRTQ